MNEPTNRPDLPDIEEDDEPTRKLVMSREVRGWMAGLAAVLVAMAAIAPSVDVNDLTGAVGSVAQKIGIDGESSCTDSDQSSGMGGQSVSCSFTCPAGPGTVTVYVDADDADAQVSGDAACGGASAHCSAKNKCTGTDSLGSAGEGSCDGESDEFIDSGLYVECTITSATDPRIPNPPRVDEICPVTSPVEVCIQPVCYHFGAASKGRYDLREQCMIVWRMLAETIDSSTTSIGYWTDGESLAGLSCRGYVCAPLELT